MKPLALIDEQLNAVTMYRLLLYGLMVVAGASILLAFLGVLSMTGISLLVSYGLSLTSCFALNILLSKLWRVPSAPETATITGLILFMILPPVTDISSGLIIIAAGLIAMVSKYLITARGRHIFNPAALAAAVLSISGLSYATWWIGSSALLPFTVILGLLVVRKIRRFSMVAVFIATALATMLAVGFGDGQPPLDIITRAFTSWPLVFAATIMLTEPATSPAKQRLRLVYAAIVGVIFASQVSVGPLSSTPEVALLVGNLFVLAVTPASRMRLRLVRKEQLAGNIINFVFEPDTQARFAAGQYIDLTLPLPFGQQDSRGNRRSFTIASAPSEKTMHFGVKFYEPSSRFKQALRSLDIGNVVSANHVRGDFVLPANTSEKLVFIAGGIGITPFRSQLADLLARDEKRDIILLYLVSDPAELVYRDILQQAEAELGLMLIPVLPAKTAERANKGKTKWSGATGPLNSELIRKHVPDYAVRTFYISGPNRMVDASKSSLKQLGVRRNAIHTDYFSGY